MSEKQDHLADVQAQLSMAASIGKTRKLITDPNEMADALRIQLELVASVFKIPVHTTDLALLELLFGAAMGGETKGLLDVATSAKDEITRQVIRELRGRMEGITMDFGKFKEGRIGDQDKAVALTSYGSFQLLQAAQFGSPQGPMMVTILQENARENLAYAGELFPSDQLLGVSGRVAACTFNLEAARALVLGGVNKAMQVYEKNLDLAA